MSERPAHGWQTVREEVLRRIAEKIWRPGDPIPNEADLAAELGCARATVNRALRSLSDDGLLDRRRKGGTRIARQPVGRATIEIPLIRTAIAERGARYGYRLIERQEAVAPGAVSAALGTAADAAFLHVVSLHLADEAPYALEDRWIVLGTVPEARDEGFEAISANEWLVRHLPFTRAESEFSAVPAAAARSGALDTAPGDALIVHRRRTWLGDKPITQVDMTFAPGHRIRTQQ
ncbi:UTRA domain-containing protein [Rhodobacteraceae bacterium 2CG4]|uniref:UTRA domain-containing protein n=1 Tax=Halovulum marinum TaxID=2662447 RepID=A0A6L5Z391_9RHOB|nr:GntR family transcriptional regulator [Halovulum marinum]MSU91018.1 UTRA domain-containing protein [Halovulum marinum]